MAVLQWRPGLLAAPVGNNRINNPDDIINMKDAYARVGRYTKPERNGYHIGFRIATRAKILSEMKRDKRLALSIIDSETGPIIHMPEVWIGEKERPVALSLSMDGYIVDQSERSARFFMSIGMRSLAELWKLYLSEKQAA